MDPSKQYPLQFGIDSILGLNSQVSNNQRNLPINGYSHSIPTIPRNPDVNLLRAQLAMAYPATNMHGSWAPWSPYYAMATSGLYNNREFLSFLFYFVVHLFNFLLIEL